MHDKQNMNPELKDTSMGGRFGKYGDMKRKARLRRSKVLKNTFYRLKQTSQRRKKDKRIKLQSTDKLKVSVEFKPDELTGPNESNA
jgi:hypothetical protein